MRPYAFPAVNSTDSPVREGHASFTTAIEVYRAVLKILAKIFGSLRSPTFTNNRDKDVILQRDLKSTETILQYLSLCNKGNGRPHNV